MELPPNPRYSGGS